MEVCFPSYVDNLHYRLYDSGSVGDQVERRESMKDLVMRTQWVVPEVARQCGLLFATNKEELLVLRGREWPKNRRSGLVQKVK